MAGIRLFHQMMPQPVGTGNALTRVPGIRRWNIEIDIGIAIGIEFLASQSRQEPSLAAHSRTIPLPIAIWTAAFTIGQFTAERSYPKPLDDPDEKRATIPNLAHTEPPFDFGAGGRRLLTLAAYAPSP